MIHVIVHPILLSNLWAHSVTVWYIRRHKLLNLNTYILTPNTSSSYIHVSVLNVHYSTSSANMHAARPLSWPIYIIRWPKLIIKIFFSLSYTNRHFWVLLNANTTSSRYSAIHVLTFYPSVVQTAFIPTLPIEWNFGSLHGPTWVHIVITVPLKFLPIGMSN